MMSSEGLVELARRFVACNDELEVLRGEIRKAVLNGGAGVEAAAPFAPARRRGGTSQHANALKAAEPEGRILELLRQRPMKMGEIVAAMGAKQSTTSERMRRLRQRGLVDLAGGAWSATG